jgi:hypothetical protein
MMVRDERSRALQWRAVLSIGLVFGWLIFLVIWLFFLAADLGASQNLAVLLVSILVLLAALAVTWVTWSITYPSPYVQTTGQFHRRPRWRTALGGASVIAWLAFVIIWLFFYANDFTLYQNFAAILASLLVVGGINWAISLFSS